MLVGLLLMPGAWASGGDPVSGELGIGRTMRWDGVATWTAGASGIVDLGTSDASTMTLAWSGGRGYIVTRTFEYAGVSPAEVFVGAGDPRNETFALPAGRVIGMTCEEGCTLAVFVREAGGTLLVEGPVADDVQWLAEDKVFTSFETDGPGPDNFYYAAKRGWLAARSPAGSDGPGTRVQGPATGSGALGLFARNATLLVETSEGRREISAATTSESREVIAGVSSGREVAWRTLVLELDDVSFARAAWDGLFAPAPVVHLEGQVSAADVHGVLHLDGSAHVLDGAQLDIVGFVDLRPDVSSVGLLAVDTDLAGDRAAMRSGIDGSATTVMIDGAAVGPAQSILGAAASTTGLLALGLLALIALKLVLPLFTRIDARTVMKNPNRRRVHDALESRPGLTTAELSRALAMTEVVVRHHLRMLEANRLVVLREHGKLKAYFTIEAAPHVERSPGVLSLKDSTRLAIARAVAGSHAPPSQADLVHSTGLSQRLVSHHLLQLEELGLVGSQGSMPKRYVASDALQGALRSRMLSEAAPPLVGSAAAGG